MSKYTDFKSKVLNKGYDIDGSFGWQCLTKDHYVRMFDGTLKPVQYLKMGDVLSTGNAVVSNLPKEVDTYNVRTTQGWFKSTLDHRVFTSNGVKTIEELTPDDLIGIDKTNYMTNSVELTDDELIFYGMWLGDGTLQYRWENSKLPTITLILGTEDKYDLVESLDVETTIHSHSNGKARRYNLVKKNHVKLAELISASKGRVVPNVLSPRQFLLVARGYEKTDGSRRGSSIILTSVNKGLLVAMQHGYHLNNISAVLSKPKIREKTNLSDNCQDIYRLTVNYTKEPLNRYVSHEYAGKDTVYVLNTDGDHSYYADNQLHHNCWDGYAEYCKYLGVPFANCTKSGYVKDIWELRKTNGMLKYFEEVSIMQAGDIAVFKEHPWTPVSHIAIFDSDIDGKYGYFLGQNQGSTITNPKGGSAFNLIKLPYEATYDTAFRLKPQYAKDTPKATTTAGGIKVGQKNVNGDIYSNLITEARPELFWSGGLRSQKDVKYIVIHGTATTSVVGAYSTWLKSKNYMTSAHYLVTPNATIGCVGENYIAWHSGGRGTITNENSIGVEHINSSIGNYNDPNTYLFDNKTIENGAKLVAEICKRLGIIPSDKTIVGHRVVSSTSCPQTLNMTDYINRVKKYYYGETSKPKVTKETKASTAKKVTKTSTGGGTATMDFTFTVKGDKAYNEGTIYYYDNARNEIVGLTHPHQLDIIRRLFRDNNGREMPHFDWNSKAPWYNRVFQVKRPKRVTANR